MPMLKTPITVLIMLLFFDSITCTGTWPGSTGAACLAGISISSQKTGIECSRFPCDQNPHNFAGVWEFRTESLSGSVRAIPLLLQHCCYWSLARTAERVGEHNFRYPRIRELTYMRGALALGNEQNAYTVGMPP